MFGADFSNDVGNGICLFKFGNTCGNDVGNGFGMCWCCFVCNYVCGDLW